MSGKRSLPSIWASRGALFAAVAAGSLVLISALGAWLLFTHLDLSAIYAHYSPRGGEAIAPEIL